MTSSETPQRRARWRYTREEGLEFERVAFFTDAVFAIAMTLLIVSIDAPRILADTVAPKVTVDPSDPELLWQALRGMGPEFFSFFLAFLLLGRYWMAHHELFAALKGVDRTLIAGNLVYLAFVAFLPFPTELVGRYETNPVSVVFFAICLAVISGMETVLFRIAYRHDLLTRTISPEEYRVGVIQSSTPVALFLISIPIAFWNPTVALLSWLLAIPLGMLLDRRTHVDSRAIMAPPGPANDPGA